MPKTDAPPITQILLSLHSEDENRALASERLYRAVYRELRRLAAGLMGRERAHHTLQPTALVNEAYIRLVDQTRIDWRDRAQFFAIAARVMRRILVDHARRRARVKRGGRRERVPLSDRHAVAESLILETLALDELLSRLGRYDARLERVVELRVFASMTVEEVAHALSVSPRTVNSDWRVAKLWLSRELRAAGYAPTHETRRDPTP